LEARYYPAMVAVKGSTGLPDYKLAKTETTVWQYNLYLNAQKKNILDESSVKRPGWGWEGNNPVVFISWYDAAQYANWLSEQRGLTPVYTIDKEQKDTNNISDIDKLKWTVTLRANANGYRLPSNAEWAYAAHGGAKQAAFEYAGSDRPDGVAWHKGNSGNRTQPVGSKSPNGAGLYDLSGNVWEWCWDWDTASFGRYRTVRGGSWKTMASNCRITETGARSPDSRDDQYGFRIVQ
ncbi:MAG TPA: SUMF1/EgtB/PvdO family nonheme iron enzyme, partial [Saprospiraceae bacterium]|nr:SUMF1/EgtB/PvdO family nonheme iron enzyme [Saprospiraceae bacterium]